MQLEINVTGNKVRFLVNGRLSRWYNGTEFAAILNLVRSAEQVEAWIKQEEGKGKAAIEAAYEQAMHEQICILKTNLEQKEPSNHHLKFSSKD
jgi:hypothetical protein